jgi:leucyl aminopeptidase (aminopeptidase T)
MPSEYSESSPEARLARHVLTKNLNVRPGEHVLIEGWSRTLPWSVVLSREARRLKALPLILYEDEDAYWDAIDHKQEALLGAAPKHEWAALGKTAVYLNMWGAVTRLPMAELPPSRRDKLLQWNPSWYDTAVKAGLRGARMEIGRVDPDLAKAYGADLDLWRDQVVAGTMVEPSALQSSVGPIVRALEKGKKLTIRDDHGTDLTLGLRQRPANVNAGRLTPEQLKGRFSRLLQLPGGSIRLALDESVADGTLVANRSCYYDMVRATGATFEFRGGKLDHAQFDEGGEVFADDFKRATKGKDRPGLLGIGLNPKLHDTPQLEDVEAGVVMVSLGGNRNLGGKNPSNFFGFGITAGAEVEVDGKPLALPTTD